MNITENNKLLAEFLGYTQPHPDYPTTTYWYKKEEDPLVLLSFDTDWNWLMEVVEKIEDLGYELQKNNNSVYFVGNYSGIKEYYQMNKFYKTKFNQDCILTRIDAFYMACVAFVKWYNENKN